MQQPASYDPWVIRIDFTSDDAWSQICKLISSAQSTAGMSFYAHVRYLNDNKYRDKSPHDVVLSLPDDYPQKFCFIVDRECIENPEHPVLVVGFYPSDLKSFDRPPRQTPPDDVVTFKALPSKIQEIENNLSIANVDFEEFSATVGADGVYRGLPQ